MMLKAKVFLAGATLLVLLARVSQAVEVSIQVTGVVESNLIGGSHAGVMPNDPVIMSFNVDSDNFVNSPSFPTRGYPLDLSSFSMTVGGNPVTLDNPQPFGPAYFVLRNNDPVVDGFVLSRNVDFPQPVSVHIPGLSPTHELDFLRTFNNGTPLSSLDILDALGFYDFTNLSVYNWTIGRFGNVGGLYTYETITLTSVPEPAMFGILVPAILGLFNFARRPRRHRALVCVSGVATPEPQHAIRAT
jgi:hypothetical protein